MVGTLSNSRTYTFRKAIDEFYHTADDMTGFRSDDPKFNHRAVLELLLAARSATITQARLTGQPLSEHMTQMLNCVSMELADRSECPCMPPSGCVWMKTKAPVPHMILPISVTDVLANQKFDPKNWRDFPLIKNSRIKSQRKRKYFAYKDTKEGMYLYLYNEEFLEQIAVNGIFEDPIAAAQYPSCGKVDIHSMCNPLDLDFKTDRLYVDRILKLAYSSLPAIRAQLADIDTLNNDIRDLAIRALKR